MIGRIQNGFACMLLLAIGTYGQTPGKSGELPPLLPRDRELALAKSAGLPAWTEQATLYVLERGGFVKVRQGSNGFSCLVMRDRPDTLEPMCFDPEGAETILPRYLRETQLREQGKSEEEVRHDTAERFRSGKYRAPRRAGIAYMLSRENRVFNGEKVIWFPPHLMFYAPYITSADIGAAPQHMPHSPLVLEEGDPHGYIIVVVPDTMPQQASPQHKH